ncbi:SRPBCC family protein [Amycolatopsis minnesotensis]|uniref:SRPBCC family protein n=1 Tax=Amycolatopsis minnesotensis TaxID=337894 RepID=A0ABN2QBY1_9PSEU
MAGNDEGGPISKLRDHAARNPATEQLFAAGEDYLQAKAQNMMSSVGDKLGAATKRLSDVAENGGTVGSLFTAGGKVAEGKSPLRAVAETGGKAIKDKVTGLFKGSKGKGGSGGKKVINIVEDIDVGVPVREAYDQWTEYQKFSSFSKGVSSAERADDTTSNWKFKIFWSNRTMKATTTEQIPDQRIVWTTDGPKGTIKGVVTFHPLGDNLTKILLVIEYYPSGLFEKTGNIWRAQGRRARLDLKHYRRFVSMAGEASGEGWRGEIRDGEVVRTHDEALDAEEAEDEPEDGYDEAEDQDGSDAEIDEESDEESDEDEYEEDDEPEDDELDEDEFEDDEFEDDGDEPEEDERPRHGARQPAGAR